MNTIYTGTWEKLLYLSPLVYYFPVKMSLLPHNERPLLFRDRNGQCKGDLQIMGQWAANYLRKESSKIVIKQNYYEKEKQINDLLDGRVAD